MTQVSDLAALKSANDGDYFIESDRGIDYRVQRIGIDPLNNLVTERTQIKGSLIRSMTQLQYDALSPSDQADGIILITA